MSNHPPSPTSHVFGPVPSRRLGRSLGVDLVPFKTCPYDCVYCQLGRTTNHTVTRAEYVPLAELLAELEQRLADGPAPDYLTLAGSGEPTLFRPLDKLIAGIKRFTAVPIVVLTNGSLLWDPQVRAEIASADVVMPSLDAGDEARFQRINRPHAAVTFERMVEGLVACRQEFAGAYWLEIMLLGGLSEETEAIAKLAALVARIEPDRVYLNTVVRPPAESWVKAASAPTLAAYAAALGPHCEVIADFAPSAVVEESAGTEGAVLALLLRRPCRLEDLATGLGLHRNEVLKYVGHLLQADQISTLILGGETYYSATQMPGP